MTRQHAERRGRQAEWLARWWLFFKGYKLIAQRWRSPVGEIDLIFRRRNMIVFVEVKLRRGVMNDAVLNPKQQQRIRNAARHFLKKDPPFMALDCRFDLIFIQAKPSLNICQITRLQNAW